LEPDFLRVCPHCFSLSGKNAAYCLFCGHRFSKEASGVVRYDPTVPRTRRTPAAKAQRFLSVCSLFIAVVIAAVILGAPPTERQILAAGGSVPSAATAALESPLKIQPFDSYNGDYDITVTLSEVSSENPDTTAASEGLRGEYFSGMMTLALDQLGSGVLKIDQLFSTPEQITVSPFINSDGVSSQNTLYGTVSHENVKLSVVCVCEESGVSGFFWLDSDGTHIEFLYHN